MSKSHWRIRTILTNQEKMIESLAKNTDVEKIKEILVDSFDDKNLFLFCYEVDNNLERKKDYAALFHNKEISDFATKSLNVSCPIALPQESGVFSTPKSIIKIENEYVCIQQLGNKHGLDNKFQSPSTMSSA